MRKIFSLLLFIPIALNAQDDLKVKTGTFDFVAYGRTYEYNGEYVISKESGGKEKLPHGKGTLKQPEKLDKAILDGDDSGVEKFTKKGYSAEPYLYDGEWQMGEKHGDGEEKKFILEKGNSIIQEHYKGNYENGLYNGKGMLKTLKFEYTGGFKAGKKHGEGAIQIVDSSPPTAQRLNLVKVKEKYEGSWNEDMFHGKGTFTSFEKKESFTGEFENHEFKQGLYTYKDGNTYNGEWKDGLPSGNGTYTWKSSGDVYVGEFVAGEPKGKGKLTKKDGSYFEGDFKNGNCTGKGKMPYNSKFYDLEVKRKEVNGIYEGEISDNKPNGKGAFASKKMVDYPVYDDKGDAIKKRLPEYSYTGGWQNGEKSGNGILETYIYDKESDAFDVLSYQGAFSQDLFEGEENKLNIVDIEYTGFEYIGGFKMGKFHGYGKKTHSSDRFTSVFEGVFINGLEHGLGVGYHFYNGSGYNDKGTYSEGYIIEGTRDFVDLEDNIIYKYTGSFNNYGQYSIGKVVYISKLDEQIIDWSNNKVKSYEGDWSNGAPNGQGTMVYKNGTSITGEFRDGEYLKPFLAPTVKIGTQIWMKENLAVTKFRNGDPIQEAKTKAEWEKAGRNGQPAWCYYDNDPANGEKYGKLYNWYAVNDPRGLAPHGAHVPSDAEWTVLSDYLGGESVAGKKMKSISEWKDGGNGTNESGFAGLPGGNRDGDGDEIFNFIGNFGYWWSSTTTNTNTAWFRVLSYNGSYLKRNNYYEGCGFSVRCLRD